MDYELVFDLADAGYKNWPFVAVGLLPIAIGAMLVKYRRGLPPSARHGKSSRAQAASAVPYLFLGFGVLWMTGTLATTGLDYLSLRSEVRSGHADVVEGRVEEFSPMPYSGHATETFTVCGVRFSYSDYDATAGFNQSRSHRGRIRQGLWVRIVYVDSEIVRLEIAIDDPGEKAECRRSTRSNKPLQQTNATPFRSQASLLPRRRGLTPAAPRCRATLARDLGVRC
jgi:hypothetical protein